MQIYPFFIPHDGCPHRCIFCDQERTAGRFPAPSPEEVGRVLARMLPAGGAGEVAFYGGTFTLLPPVRQRAYLQAAASFSRRGRVGGIRVSTRPDALGEEETALLKEQGVTTVEVGCQSFDPAVLDRARRGHDAAAPAAAVRRLRKAGLAVGLQLMPGLPGGGRAEALASLEQALALAPDFLRIYPTVVVKGTPLEKAFHRGEYRPWSLEEALEVATDLWLRCRRAGMPVIRLGLQGHPALDRGDVLAAGPYHPAFGQLVRSRAWLRMLLWAVRRTGARTAAVHPRDFSDALGHRRENLGLMQERVGDFALHADPGAARETASLGNRLFDLVRDQPPEGFRN